MEAIAPENPSSTSSPGLTGVFEDLRHVQDRHGFVSAAEITLIAKRRGVNVRDVHTVASFYPHFHLKQPVPVDVRVCDDMTCHLRGSCALRNTLQRKYAHLPEIVRVRDISCIGRCDHAPVISVNERFYQDISADEAAQVIDREI